MPKQQRASLKWTVVASVPIKSGTVVKTVLRLGRINP